MPKEIKENHRRSVIPRFAKFITDHFIKCFNTKTYEAIIKAYKDNDFALCNELLKKEGY